MHRNPQPSPSSILCSRCLAARRSRRASRPPHPPRPPRPPGPPRPATTRPATTVAAAPPRPPHPATATPVTTVAAAPPRPLHPTTATPAVPPRPPHPRPPLPPHHRDHRSRHDRRFPRLRDHRSPNDHRSQRPTRSATAAPSDQRAPQHPRPATPAPRPTRRNTRPATNAPRDRCSRRFPCFVGPPRPAPVIDALPVADGSASNVGRRTRSLNVCFRYVLARIGAHNRRIVCAQPGHGDGSSPHRRYVCSRRRLQTTGHGRCSRQSALGGSGPTGAADTRVRAGPFNRTIPPKSPPLAPRPQRGFGAGSAG
jgi:hypothetical protein